MSEARTSPGGFAVFLKATGKGEIVEHVEVVARVLKDGSVRIAPSSRGALPKGKVHLLVVSDSAGRRPAEECEDWLTVLVNNPAFDFLKGPAEDIYTLKDGKPYRAEE